MKNHSEEELKNIFLESIQSLPKQEQHFIHHLLEGKHISRNVNNEFDKHLTFGQRVADKVASFGGSWTFIIIFLSVLIAWIILNTFILTKANSVFDPYPYILLNLLLSMTAALQAPIIMMSQNRQAVKDRLDASHDYEVNLKAELEIANLHEKIDELRNRQWAELVEMQQEQIRLLTVLLDEKTG